MSKHYSKRQLIFGPLALLLPAMAHAGVFSTTSVQDYPRDWPLLTGMSTTCQEIEGTYIDPNTWRYEYEEKPGSPLGEKSGGTRDAAWAAFGLSYDDVQAGNKKINQRTFTLSFHADRSLVVHYFLDGKPASSRIFTAENYSCDKDGLTLTIHDRTGVVLDKFPNEGHTTGRSTLYKSGQYLYIRVTHKTQARVVKILPQSFFHVRWFRFAQQASP